MLHQNCFNFVQWIITRQDRWNYGRMLRNKYFFPSLITHFWRDCLAMSRKASLRVRKHTCRSGDAINLQLPKTRCLKFNHPGSKDRNGSEFAPKWFSSRFESHRLINYVAERKISHYNLNYYIDTPFNYSNCKCTFATRSNVPATKSIRVFL